MKGGAREVKVISACRRERWDGGGGGGGRGSAGVVMVTGWTPHGVSCCTIREVGWRRVVSGCGGRCDTREGAVAVDVGPVDCGSSLESSSGAAIGAGG